MAVKLLSVPPPPAGKRVTIKMLSADVATLLQAYADLHADVKAIREELASYQEGQGQGTIGSPAARRCPEDGMAAKK